MSALEVALSALLGGMGGSVVGVFATHYFEEKREYRKVKAEEWKTVVDEVYSPLMFDLKQVQKGTLLILGTWGAAFDKFPADQVAGMMTKMAQVQVQNQRRQSQIFEDILRKRSRLIKPSSLWRDLYLFYSFLHGIEDVFLFISTDMFKESPARLAAAVKSAAKVGESLDNAATWISDATEKIVVHTAEVPKSPTYTPFFTYDVLAKIDKEITSLRTALVGD